MRAVVALAAAFTLAACQTPCPAPDTGPTTATFECEDGSTLEVTFARRPDSARVVQEGYTTIDLPARITGSGFRYADGGAELRGRGSSAQWTRPGAEETACERTS